jgi:hypothetical protein
VTSLQQVRHDPLELRAEPPLVALGQALKVLDQIGHVERRHVVRAQRRHLLLDPKREVLIV